jgi:hypothetical protein
MEMAKAEKVFKAGIQRDNDLMYYVKGGDIWAVPRKKPGQPRGKAKLAVKAGIEPDYAKYLYFVDSDGDIARKERQVGGTLGSKRRVKRTKSKPIKPVKGPSNPSKTKTKPPVKKSAKPSKKY